MTTKKDEKKDGFYAVTEGGMLILFAVYIYGLAKSAGMKPKPWGNSSTFQLKKCRNENVSLYKLAVMEYQHTLGYTNDEVQYFLPKGVN